MKENGMNKLIKLLDEYDSVQYHKINHKIENGSIYRNVSGTDGWYEVWRYCKQFGFIKWLVDNDKINTQNLITYMNGTSLTFNKVPSTDCVSIDKTWNNFYTECLLMLLAIQDKPIEFLISILN